MSKLQESLYNARKLGDLFVKSLLDLHEGTRDLLKASLKAYGAGDPSEIKENDLRTTAQDLETQSKKLLDLSDRINDLLEECYDIDLSKF